MTANNALELFEEQTFDLVATKPLAILLLSVRLQDTLGLSQQNTDANAVIQKSSNEAGHLIRAEADPASDIRPRIVLNKCHSGSASLLHGRA
jgi:hypothetical protein